MQDPTQLASFENSIGRKTDMFLYYQSIGEDLAVDKLLPIAQQGRVIQLAWEPWNPGAPDLVNQPSYRLSRITAGYFDADIHRWAREMRDFGYPVIIRPMGEMNGDWTSWSGSVNGNSPADYIPAWRHIHDIFVQEGATNVKWDWSPNRDGDTASATNTFNTYYPGDAYVDYVGIDGYNWGTLYNTPAWTSQWQDIDTIFGPSYDVFTTRTSKPAMISETASTEVGGSKADWITNAFARLPVRFPRVESLTWFNIDKETDWRVESSPASLAAFRAAVAPADTTPPAVSFATPADGSTISGDATITVNASDNTAVAKVELYAGDSLVASSTAAPYSFTLPTRSLTDGAYTLRARAYDNAGNTADTTINVNITNSGDRNYFFGWYDDATPGMQSWVVVGNPGATAQHAEVYVGGQLMGAYDIGPDQRVTPMYPGVMNGPVKVVSTTGGDLLASERSLYNGTFSELAATPEADLATDAYLAWYDEQTPGMHTWVVVGNQGSQTAQVDVTIAGQAAGHYEIPAGGRVAPDFPGIMNGPVHVTASNGQPLNVSERVVMNGSFNETAAAAAPSLSSEYYFTWYDNASPGMHTWVVVGNQGSQATDVDIYVGGRLMGRYNVPAGGRVAPQYAGTVDGPVRVVSTGGQPLVASQRSLYLNSFEEVPGTPPGNLVDNQFFAWYDSASPGMRTWVLVGNQSSEPADVDVKIAGSVVGHYTIPAGGRITPVFPGQMNGPVEVTGTQGRQLVISQRVIYNSSFDEVGGRALQ